MKHDMQDLANRFLAWCKEHSNSPDITNFHYWLTIRAQIAASAEIDTAVMRLIGDPKMRRFSVGEPKAESVEDLL